MIFEYIVAPRLEDLELNEVENLEHSRRLLDILGQFPPDLPVYIDISSHEKWSAFVEETLSMLFGLIVSSQFLLTTTATLQKLADWSNSDAILTTFQVPSVLNHGDLSGDNVFVTPDGYKIIDWQRSVRGPAGLDLASYLFTMGMEPSTHTRREIIQINWFLHLRWFVECKLHWFPPGKSYDRQVAELSNLILSPQG
jgi:thiamine kinase-like enzyme